MPTNLPWRPPGLPAMLCAIALMQLARLLLLAPRGYALSVAVARRADALANHPPKEMVR